jgi:hypothetical protein
MTSKLPLNNARTLNLRYLIGLLLESLIELLPPRENWMVKDSRVFIF